MDMTWHQTKAAEMIERELASIAKSPYPSDDFCSGLTQMAFALGLISDKQEREYAERAADVVRERRRQLREAKIQDAIRRST